MTKQADSAGFTKRLAELICGTRINALPDETISAARNAILDWFGVAVAGTSEPLSQILIDEFATGSSCSIIGCDKKASAHDAALINGSISHALDYDDVHPFVGHPTVAILPAVFAVAEQENLGGAAVIEAYIAGYEAAAIVGKCAMPSHYVRGFHSTATIGSIGAAAGVAKLLGLKVEQTAIAIGLSATQAAGLKAMFGTMAKPLHAGKAAANGVMAAKLAAAGFTANDHALEADQGFFATQCDSKPMWDENYSYGKYVRGNLYKFHAACYLTHSSIEALGQLRDEHDLTPDNVKEVQIRVPEGHLKVCNIEEPQTGLEAKFSLRHVAALTLAREQTASIATYSDASARDPAMSAFRQKVMVTGDSDITGSSAAVSVVSAGDAHLEMDFDVAKQKMAVDAEYEALKAKFQALIGDVPGRQASVLIEALDKFDQLERISDLFALTKSAANA